MDRLRDVLGSKTRDLARVLEVQAGLDGALANRFVRMAGADLIESYLWQEPELEGRELVDPSTSRDLLSAASAARIADELGMSRAQVWHALRAFVPHVLRLASVGSKAKSEPRRSEPPSMGGQVRWSGPVLAGVPALLHPMD